MVFDCIPAEGMIAAGDSSKINVTFNPDHASLLFADLAHVYISNKVWMVWECMHGACDLHLGEIHNQVYWEGMEFTTVY